MKKAALSLVVAALIFAAGLTGFFLGKRSSPDPVILSRPQVQTVPTLPTAGVETTSPGPVDINTASAAQLETLPGIGPVLAQRIIDYRQEHGPFQSISELTMVSGIGLSILETLMDLITVGGQP